jgi:hypothetical protein
MTLIEGAVACVVVALVAVAGIRAVTIAAAARTTVDARARGMLYAQELAERIASLRYQDDATPGAPIGLDAGEIAGDPATMDDVDDFHGLKASPITDANGDVVTTDAWAASVSVAWVDWSNGGIQSPTETGLKRIEVQVTLSGKVVAREVITRALAWDVAIENGGAP